MADRMIAAAEAAETDEHPMVWCRVAMEKNEASSRCVTYVTYVRAKEADATGGRADDSFAS